ncbi:FAD/NAD-P-binding domain-containing protein [Trametes maxima]|nr:FAD/NAD-P-binding domain-containing protein [Trametes maxima]
MPGGWFSRLSTAHSAGAPTPRPPFTLGDFTIDEYKPIKVIVIGAGFCGILAGIRLPQKIPNIDLTIYEKSAGIGGTWQNNNYPGLACDVPAHSYQFSFEQKKDWTTFYPSGPEVRQHLQDVVDKYKLMRYIRLRHEVVHAQYDAPAGKWRVRIRRPAATGGAPEGEQQPEGYEEVEDIADVLITAVGALSRWTWPDIPGLHDFQGALHHSAGFEPQPARWEDTVETWADKNVAVIGVGSSAIQIVPALQKRVMKLVHYVRGKTWLAAPFGTGLIRNLIGRDPADDGNFCIVPRGSRELDADNFTPEEIERFKNEPGFFENFRLTLENQFNSTFSWTMRGSPLQLQFQADCRKLMQEKLAKKPWIADKLMPDFPVSCRRLTPGPGYLEALCEDNVEFVSSSIKRVTKNGIETVDGQYHNVDVIVCATGYDTSFQLPFKIIGRDGVDINERWRPHPVSYLSVALDGFPNMFMALGPNSALASGTLLPLMESQVGYAVQAVAKLQRDRLKSMEVKPEAVKDFDEYLEAYFPKTVFTEKCRSWYKMGKEEGRVVGLWPGSTLQGMKALANPRWEDYKYELEDRVQNRFYFLGDGQTYNEKTLTGDSE